MHTPGSCASLLLLSVCFPFTLTLPIKLCLFSPFFSPSMFWICLENCTSSPASDFLFVVDLFHFLITISLRPVAGARWWRPWTLLIVWFTNIPKHIPFLCRRIREHCVRVLSIALQSVPMVCCVSRVSCLSNLQDVWNGCLEPEFVGVGDDLSASVKKM